MDSTRTAPRILVVGCGGIGGVLLSRLLESGRKVSAVARREEIAQALRT
ncbi:MAG TPA: 2-dehydropantoate 2-reductase N-terminal domain-containing protein, partial [Archangium sp.]